MGLMRSSADAQAFLNSQILVTCPIVKEIETSTRVQFLFSPFTRSNLLTFPSPPLLKLHPPLSFPVILHLYLFFSSFESFPQIPLTISVFLCLPNTLSLFLSFSLLPSHLLSLHVLKACSDFDRTVQGVPFPHPTPQGLWVQSQRPGSRADFVRAASMHLMHHRESALGYGPPPIAGRLDSADHRVFLWLRGGGGPADCSPGHG